MCTIEPGSRRAAAGLTASLGLLAIATLAVWEQAPARLFAAEPAVDLQPLFKAEDFWSRTGAQMNHPEISGRDVSAVRELAGNSPDPAVRIRAYKVLADLHGRTRYANKVSESQSRDAIEATFRYLETHLSDPTIAKFHPELGFSHVGLANRSNDKEDLWLLIEFVDSVLPSGGLNVHWNSDTKAVDKVEHWGTTRDLMLAVPANKDAK